MNPHTGELAMLREGEERAGEPGDRRRDDEGSQLVAVGRIALETRARLVLADRHQPRAEAAARELPGDQQRDDAEQEKYQPSCHSAP